MSSLVQNEPIAAATVVPIVVWIGAYFGAGVDQTTATAIALVVLAIAGWVARNFSVPRVRHDQVVSAVTAAAASAPPVVVAPVVPAAPAQPKA